MVRALFFVFFPVFWNSFFFCETQEWLRGSEKPHSLQQHVQFRVKYEAHGALYFTNNLGYWRSTHQLQKTFWILRLQFSVSPTRPSSGILSADRKRCVSQKRSVHAESVEESPQKNQSACLPPALQRLGQIIIMAYENFTWNSASSETSRGCVIAPPVFLLALTKHV